MMAVEVPTGPSGTLQAQSSADTPAAGAPELKPVGPTAQSDKECIEAVLAGKRERYQELVERHQRAVFSVVLGYVKDAHRAEDLAQEVFTQAFQALGQLREKERFVFWLMQSARNRALRAAKGDPRRKEQTLQPDEDRQGTVASLVVSSEPEEKAQERTAGVMALVEGLPDLYRETLRLKYQEGLSCKEIAQREGVSIGTITSRLTRAVAVLRSALGVKHKKV